VITRVDLPADVRAAIVAALAAALVAAWERQRAHG
jgi:hypothetical protein